MANKPGQSFQFDPHYERAPKPQVQGQTENPIMPQLPLDLKKTSAVTAPGTIKSSTHATKSSSRYSIEALMKIWLKVWSLRKLIWAIFLYIFISSITMTAENLSGVLSSISTTNGIILLNVLGLLYTYAFTALADELWEKIQWGPLLKRGEPLLTFITLSAGWDIWWKVLLRRGWEPKQHPRWWSFGR